MVASPFVKGTGTLKQPLMHGQAHASGHYGSWPRPLLGTSTSSSHAGRQQRAHIDVAHCTPPWKDDLPPLSPTDSATATNSAGQHGLHGASTARHRDSPPGGAGSSSCDAAAAGLQYGHDVLPAEGQYRYAVPMYADPVTGMTSPVPPPQPDPIQELCTQVHAEGHAWGLGQLADAMRALIALHAAGKVVYSMPCGMCDATWGASRGSGTGSGSSSSGGSLGSPLHVANAVHVASGPARGEGDAAAAVPLARSAAAAPALLQLRLSGLPAQLMDRLGRLLHAHMAAVSTKDLGLGREPDWEFRDLVAILYCCCKVRYMHAGLLGVVLDGLDSAWGRQMLVQQGHAQLYADIFSAAMEARLACTEHAVRQEASNGGLGSANNNGSSSSSSSDSSTAGDSSRSSATVSQLQPCPAWCLLERVVQHGGLLDATSIAVQRMAEDGRLGPPTAYSMLLAAAALRPVPDPRFSALMRSHADLMQAVGSMRHTAGMQESGSNSAVGAADSAGFQSAAESLINECEASALGSAGGITHSYDACQDDIMPIQVHASSTLGNAHHSISQHHLMASMHADEVAASCPSQELPGWYDPRVCPVLLSATLAASRLSQAQLVAVLSTLALLQHAQANSVKSAVEQTHPQQANLHQREACNADMSISSRRPLYAEGTSFAFIPSPASIQALATGVLREVINSARSFAVPIHSIRAGTGAGLVLPGQVIACICALASIGYRDEQLYHKACDVLLRDEEAGLRGASTGDWSRLALALAKAGVQHSPLSRAMASALLCPPECDEASAATSPPLSSKPITGPAAAAEHDHMGQAQASRGKHDMALPQRTAAGSKGYPAEQEAASTAALYRRLPIEHASASDCARLLWAIATWGRCPADGVFISVLIGQLSSQLQYASIRDIARAAWALAMLDQLPVHGAAVQQMLDHADAIHAQLLMGQHTMPSCTDRDSASPMDSTEHGVVQMSLLLEVLSQLRYVHECMQGCSADIRKPHCGRMPQHVGLHGHLLHAAMQADTHKL